MPNHPLPQGSVQKYAPAVKFHADEQNFPCSIEFLMNGGKLEYRRWNEPEEITAQQTVTPSLSVLQSSLYMLYTGVSDQEVWMTRSSDGANWANPQKAGLQASNLAITTFQGRLWMVYSGVDDFQVI